MPLNPLGLSLLKFLEFIPSKIKKRGCMLQATRESSLHEINRVR